MIIEKCTEIEPKKRFKSITSLRGTLLKLLSESQNLTPSPSATEWEVKLQNLSDWKIQQLEDFARFMKSTQDDSDLWVVCRVIDEDVLNTLYLIDRELWQLVALAYCEWSHGSFDFDYCDVIIKRLEVIFELGNLDIKSSAALASAKLGYSHNRWFVMGKVLIMLGTNLDNLVAQRIAIEIRVEEVHKQFVSCAEFLKRSINEYHPQITEVLVEHQKK